MGSLTVAKFGGTSMGSDVTMLGCADVILSNPDTRVVVVSATSGTTNQLIELANTACNSSWKKAQPIIAKILERHIDIAEKLNGSDELKETVKNIIDEAVTLAKGMSYLHEVSPRAMDSLLSIGERVSSLLFTQAINYKAGKEAAKVFDVRQIMITDTKFGSAEPQPDEIKKQTEEFLVPDLYNHITVTQGFVGKSKKGETTTLGRGGSDYSATLIGEAIGAQIVEIWTDVSGVATTDPRIVPQANIIPEISFPEAAEMATAGAKVLHPQTLVPAMRCKIPVFVGNSFKPKDGGTWIKSDTDNKPIIRAIALRRNQQLVTISSLKMVNAYGFLQNIFSILAKYKISIDLITTSEVSVALTLDQPYLLTEEVIQEISQFAEIKSENSYSLVSIVGNEIITTPGISAKTFSTISDYNVRMICLGASKYNMCFLVNADDGEIVVQKLHKIFLENE